MPFAPLPRVLSRRTGSFQLPPFQLFHLWHAWAGFSLAASLRAAQKAASCCSTSSFKGFFIPFTSFPSGNWDSASSGEHPPRQSDFRIINSNPKGFADNWSLCRDRLLSRREKVRDLPRECGTITTPFRRNRSGVDVSGERRANAHVGAHGMRPPTARPKQIRGACHAPLREIIRLERLWLPELAHLTPVVPLRRRDIPTHARGCRGGVSPPPSASPLAHPSRLLPGPGPCPERRLP
jgi:hypothetical protein